MDEIALFINYDVQYVDMSELTRFTGVIGGTDIENKRISICKNLDPVEFPDMEGRNNFTIGHELGHIVLHSRNPNLVAYSLHDSALEYEANLFSSVLLMPKKLVLQAASTFLNGHNFELHCEIMMRNRKNHSRRLANCELREMVIEEESKKFISFIASKLKVSKQAAEIRLTNLGLDQFGLKLAA